MLLDTLQGYLVPPPPPAVAFFMQHLEICLPTALLTTEAYFSFQLSLTLSLLLFLKNVNNILRQCFSVSYWENLDISLNYM